VIDVQQAVLGAVGAARQREEGQVVAIVAKLLALRVGSLAHRVEVGGAGQDPVAPADQNLGAVAGRNLVVFLDHLLERLEAERGGAAPSREREPAGQRAADCTERRRGDEALQRRPAAHAGLVQFQQRPIARAV
jgi:hypothetical protein